MKIKQEHLAKLEQAIKDAEKAAESYRAGAMLEEERARMLRYVLKLIKGES